MEHLTLDVIPGSYAICRLDPGGAIPSWALTGRFFSVTRTAYEMSVICELAAAPTGVLAERGWRGVAVQGPLDLSAIGILAGLTGALASASVSTVAVSTYDTDYLFVRDADLQRAVRALRGAGHHVREP